MLGIETTCDETAAAVIERRERRLGADPVQHRAFADRGAYAVRRRGAGDRRARPCRRARRHHVAAAMKESRHSLSAIVGGRRGRGSRPDRRRHRRPDHRKGDRDGARHAADRGQSSRGPRADATADLRAGVSVLSVSGLRRPHPDRRRHRRRRICPVSAPPSTTQWAKPSTRSPKCWRCPIRAARRSSARRSDGDPQTVCVSAADARASRRQFLAVGIEDRGA